MRKCNGISKGQLVNGVVIEVHQLPHSISGSDSEKMYDGSFLMQLRPMYRMYRPGGRRHASGSWVASLGSQDDASDWEFCWARLHKTRPRLGNSLLGIHKARCDHAKQNFV